jgi:RNase P subunit RPR2
MEAAATFVHVGSTPDMAQTEALEKRLAFLQHASRQLALASPTVSANLGAGCDKLLSAQDADLEASRKERDAYRREVCGACGSLMVPGLTCAVSQEGPAKPSKRIQKDTPGPTNGPSKAMRYSCLRCGRSTFLTLQPTPASRAKRLTKGKQGHPTETVKGVAEGPSVPRSANASSRQRAKARKGGLQAMLVKSKTQTQGSATGLDLMDFMA